MRYRYGKKIRKHRGRQILISSFALLSVAAGMYILLLLMAPQTTIAGVNTKWNKPVPSADLSQNRLYIPKLKLNLTYKAGDASVLNDNVWHRFADRGDPEKGGNFILAGHRFEIGLTPGETIRKSPFYHIDALKKGDKLYVDFGGKRYLYEVAERFRVEPNQTEIEAPTEKAKMTLYTCTLEGAADGRDVIIAYLIEKDINPTTPLLE